jgi:hypothetical protein
MTEALPPALRALCELERCRRLPEYFATRHLAHHARLPFAPFHRVLFAWHAAMGGPVATRRGRRHVIAAPRGFAKSTVASLILTLHDIIFAREPYIVLLSATERQAAQRLAAIRRELTRPALAHLVAGGILQSTRHSLSTPHCRMEARGAGAELRGLLHDAHRPTKILLDDAEASAAASSEAARLRLHDWFAEVVEHLGGVYTNILAVGTILHPRGLLATLAARADFSAHIVRAVETFPPATAEWAAWRALLLDMAQPARRAMARAHFLAHRAAMEYGAVVAWPEKEDIEELMAQLTLQGRRAFYQEKQNTPLGPEDALFPIDRIPAAIPTTTGWTIQLDGPEGARPLRQLDHAAHPLRFGYLDAAMANGPRADFAALASVLLWPDGTMIADLVTARRIAPSAQVAMLFAEHAAHPFQRLAIEGTGFQQLLTMPIAEEERRRRAAGTPMVLPIVVVHPRQAKAHRIAALEPHFLAGRLALSGRVDEELREELANWPRCAHDDALDALAGAVELARRHAADAPRVSMTAPRRRAPMG